MSAPSAQPPAAPLVLRDGTVADVDAMGWAWLGSVDSACRGLGIATAALREVRKPVR